MIFVIVFFVDDVCGAKQYIVEFQKKSKIDHIVTITISIQSYTSQLSLPTFTTIVGLFFECTHDWNLMDASNHQFFNQIMTKSVYGSPLYVLLQGFVLKL